MDSHRGLPSLAYLMNVSHHSSHDFQKMPGSPLNMRSSTFASVMAPGGCQEVPVWEVCGCSMSHAQSGPEAQLAWACKAGSCLHAARAGGPR